MTEEKDEFYGDYRRVERTIHPVHVEFLSIPSYFDINHYLTIREVTGQFMSHEITLESVTLIADAIKEGPVFTLSSPSGKYAASAIFAIEIFKKAGLQIQAFSNFMPIDVNSYESILSNSRFTKEDGTPVINMSFNFINLFKCIEEGIMEPVIQAVQNAEEYANDMAETAAIYKS